jgi:integrase
MHYGLPRLNAAIDAGIFAGMNKPPSQIATGTHMTRQTNKLTALAVKNVKYGEKPSNKHPDGGGLYLFTEKNGGKYWRMNYRHPISKKENTLSFGIYPTVTLEDARRQRDDTRRLIQQNIDPAEHRNEKRRQAQASLEHTFEAIATSWLAFRSIEKKQDAENIRRLHKDVLPYIGTKPINSLTAPQIERDVLARIVERGAIESAHRVKMVMKMIFEYAHKKGLILSKPTEYITLPSPTKGHHAAIIEANELRPMLQKIWAYTSDNPRNHIHTEAALKLSVLVFLRPNEIRKLKWESFDKEERLLKIIASKTHTPHIVPLPTQAMQIMAQMEGISRHSPYVFPHQSKPHDCMSEGTVNGALKRLGYSGKQTAHGLRATARTMMDERLFVRTDFLEHQLAHTVKDPNGVSYNRSKYLDERFKMMQQWADYLDNLRDSTVIYFPKATA